MKQRIVRPRTIAETRRRPSFRVPPVAPRVKLRVCCRNFVYAGQVKVGEYIAERRTIRFLDRCKKRGIRRGSRFVEVSIDEFPTLGTLCCEVEEEHV